MTKTEPDKDSEQTIADKILHILSIYPKVSPSMLQISIGSGIPTAMWKPVLEKLISQKQIIRTEQSTIAPNGRKQHHTILALTN